MNKLKKIFKKDKNIIIGAIHFPPLLGYVDFPGLKIALNNALKDLTAFEKGGVDGIIFENNYDIPHKIFADSSVVASMTYLGEQIKKAIKLPLGISVLWNDYYTALSIAKILNLQFIRIPVFVDNVKTDYGII
ncbi:MAG: phosphorybosylanthranilate isomerase, partial [Candidatus Portnoybacteria bacterium]|nr:phosphorybosylanthranilate isomerase [Candidatus Portnoybacteria bacterium]